MAAGAIQGVIGGIVNIGFGALRRGNFDNWSGDFGTGFAIGFITGSLLYGVQWARFAIAAKQAGVGVSITSQLGKSISTKEIGDLLVANGSKVRLVTSQTVEPIAGENLYVAVGEGAEQLASAAIPNGTLFVAEVPEIFLTKIELLGFAEKQVLSQVGTRAIGTSYFISGSMTKYIASLFRAI
jgi:hypothetical protein